MSRLGPAAKWLIYTISIIGFALTGGGMVSAEWAPWLLLIGGGVYVIAKAVTPAMEERSEKRLAERIRGGGFIKSDKLQQRLSHTEQMKRNIQEQLDSDKFQTDLLLGKKK